MTTRHTFLLDTTNPDHIEPTSVLVVREKTGEIRLVVVDGNHRACEEREESIISYGGVVLARIEGERNLSTRDASVWA